MLVIAHRGASGLEPENTLRSFKKAESLGAGMIELDVRQSKDGELVVFHDRTLRRLFGVNKRISKLIAAELKAISVNREIPTLDEVLAGISTDLNIELKIHGIERLVLEKIKTFPHKVLISSSFPGILKKVRALDGNIRLGLILPVRKFYFMPIVIFLTRKLNLYAIHPRNYIVSYPAIQFLRQFAERIFVWTVNSDKEFQRMQKLGVDGVFTDNPEMFV